MKQLGISRMNISREENPLCEFHIQSGEFQGTLTCPHSASTMFFHILDTRQGFSSGARLKIDFHHCYAIWCTSRTRKVCIIVVSIGCTRNLFRGIIFRLIINPFLPFLRPFSKKGSSFSILLIVFSGNIRKLYSLSCAINIFYTRIRNFLPRELINADII